MNTVSELVLLSSDQNNNGRLDQNSCVTVDFDGATYPKTLTVDFGEGCEYGKNEVKLQGSPTAILSAPLYENGSTISVSLNNFIIEDTLEVAGNFSFGVEEVDILEKKIVSLSMNVSEATISTPEQTITLNADMTVERMLNELKELSDNDLRIPTLSMNITKEDGGEVNVTLDEALFYEAECFQFVSGDLSITAVNNGSIASLHFGDGTCDGKATINTTIIIEKDEEKIEKEHTYEITLPNFIETIPETVEDLRSSIEERMADLPNVVVHAYTTIIEVFLLNSEGNDNGRLEQRNCPSVEFSGAQFPKSITLDFGEGCDYREDGSIIQGSITAELSAPLRQESSNISLTLTDFVVLDTVELSGTFTLTTGEVDVFGDGKISFSVEVEGASVTTPSETFALDASATTVWLLNTLNDLTDDDLEIPAFTMNLVKEGEVDLDLTLRETLYYESDCYEFVSGILRIDGAGYEFPSDIDFGDGNCDQLAIVTTTVSFEWYGFTFEEEISFDIDLP